MENIKQELAKNKEMKESIKKFRDEAKKLEESDALREARRKYVSVLSSLVYCPAFTALSVNLSPQLNCSGEVLLGWKCSVLNGCLGMFICWNVLGLLVFWFFFNSGKSFQQTLGCISEQIK